jgi:DNA-binding CsgD family transcriptional regulator
VKQESNQNSLASHPVINNDEKILTLLRELESYSKLFFFTAHLTDRTLEYVSPSFQTILGYSPEEFIAAGPDLLYSMVDPATIPEIVRIQQGYIRRAKEIGFDPKEITLFEFPDLPLTGKNKKTTLFNSYTTVLSYSSGADLDFSIVIFLESSDPQIEHYKHLLRRIKERHNTIYQHKPMKADASPLKLVLVTTNRFDSAITYREREVLALLARGFSTKMISDELGLSAHTAETHRKKLLRKFDANNSAELIKKASKVFWLE